MLIPSTNPPAKVMWSEPSRYAIVYPCVGLLAEEGARRAPAPLTKLLGPVRAAVLDELREPRSTSQLVAITGYSLGSIGAHLKILLDAGLVRRGRAGRSVLYYRTASGNQHIKAAAEASRERTW